VDPAQWAVVDLMPLSDDTKGMIITTMNNSFKEVLNVYAKHFCGKSDTLSAQLAQVDEAKFVLRLFNTDAQVEDSTIGYQNSAGVAIKASRTGDVRRILFEMAKVASQATGVELNLPTMSCYSDRKLDAEPGAYILNDVVDLKSLECLNEDTANPVTNLFRKSYAEDGGTQSATPLQSDPDVDHQLLIKFSFQLPVKLKAIKICAQADDETAPQVVKIFQGQMSMGFQEAEDEAAVQTLELSTAQIDAGDPSLLRFTKFQNVTSLQLFVQTNFGAEISRIAQLELWGTLVETVDMRAWKPIDKTVVNPLYRETESQMDGPLDPF
jgi:hypothetical protein